MSKPEQGILVVSFGSTYADTREKNITAIEETIAGRFPDFQVYRAFTSRMILATLKKRDNIHYDTVEEALERMVADGIRRLVVQPTHVINGIENTQMKDAVSRYTHLFESIAIGEPLLTQTSDYEKTVHILGQALSAKHPKTAVVFMGHGTDHFANAAYPALDYTFKAEHFEDCFMVTVEGYPSFETLLNNLKKHAFEKIILTPFMVVAGDHARNDMAGEEADSLANLLRAEGYDVSVLIKGLGEYPAIRELYCEHVQAAINNQ